VSHTHPEDCTVTAAKGGAVAVLEECDGTASGGTVTDPYNLQIEYTYTSSSLGIGPIVKPTIINLTDDDGDGRAERVNMIETAVREVL
jgi:hypothetical protein